ncbi:amino acid adenylation domain-containing protein [Streptococcus mutans]|uniref:amino acid adenylation domain-containing protein n=1 Tax=Streptococcus mutans TaxID=1309 RepID=UPI0038B868AA
MTLLKELISYYENKTSKKDFRSILDKYEREIYSNHELSEDQLGIWTECNLDIRNNSSYNVPVAIDFKGNLDSVNLKEAIKCLLMDYPMLNSVITTESDYPVRAVKKSFEPNIEFIDLTLSGAEEFEVCISKITHETITLDDEYLYKFYCLKLDNSTKLIINVHHIIFDGSSIIRLVDDLLDKYTAFELNTDFKFFPEYESFDSYVNDNLNISNYNDKLKYWKQKFSDLNFLDNNKVFERQELDSYQDYTLRLTDEMSKDLREFCSLYKITPYTIFFLIYRMFLLKNCNVDDLVIGTPISRRNDSKYKESIGYFVSMLPIRYKLSTDSTVSEAISSLSKELKYSRINSLPLITINKIFRQQTTNKQLFNFSFSYQNYMKDEYQTVLQKYGEALKMKVSFDKSIHQRGEFPIVFEVFEDENIFEIRIKFSKELIDVNSSIFDELSEIINTLLKSDRTTRINEIIGLGVVENDYKQFFEKFSTIARKYNKNEAIKYGENCWTYEELLQNVENLINYFSEIELRKGDVVGTYFSKTPELIAVYIALFSMGIGVVPIEKTLPNSRIKSMLEETQVQQIIIKEDSLPEDIASTKEIINIADLSSDLKIQHRYDLKIKTPIGREKETLAYILYTSGSTGKPKGVMISTTSLINFIESMKVTPGISQRDSLLSITSLNFDIVFLEILVPIFSGGRVIIAPENAKKDPEVLLDLIKSTSPTVLQATPVTCQLLFQIGWTNTEKIKILCGGEKISDYLHNRFIETNSAAWNMYGPTEATIWSSVSKIDENKILLGKPINGNQYYVLDDNFSPVKEGGVGQLFIGGTGLSLGYFDNFQKNQESFIQNQVDGQTIYNTGDLVRYISANKIEYLGRMNNQVKINGYRIELEDIEANIEKCSFVKRCIVTPIDSFGSKKLYAQVIVENEEYNNKEISKILKKELKTLIPTYMIPSYFNVVDSFPLNTSGKIDRKQIKNILSASKIINRSNSNKEVNITQKIKEILKEILVLDEIYEDRNFFEQGLDSVGVVRLVKVINDRYGANLTTTDIFENSSIQRLGNFISGQNSYDHNIQEQETVLDRQADKKVAVIGISCKTYDSNNYREFWDKLTRNVESVTSIKNNVENSNEVFIRSSLYDKYYFDNNFFGISNKEAKLLDPQYRQLLMQSWSAFEDAGYIPKTKDVKRTSVYMTASNSGYINSPNLQSNDEDIIVNSDSYREWLFRQPGTLPTLISYHLGLEGPSMFLHSNCSSGLLCLDKGVQDILNGVSEYSLVGGASLNCNNNVGYEYREGMNFSNSGHIRAFDNDADGMVSGEGVATLLLKDAAKAEQDGDDIYAYIISTATNNDGNEKGSFFAPSIQGQKNVIESALQNLVDKDVNYVECHGTGTKLGDPIEFKGLLDAYNDATELDIGSVKSNIGHLDCVSGLISCIKVILSLYNGLFPASINYNKLNNQIPSNSKISVLNENKMYEKHKNIKAAVSSFGIGGTNAHVIFQKNITDSRGTVLKNYENLFFPISGKDEMSLKANEKSLLKFLKNSNGRSNNLSKISDTLIYGRKHWKHRRIYIADKLSTLIEKLETEDYDSIDKVYSDNNEHAMQWLKGEPDSLLKKHNFVKTHIPTYEFNCSKFVFETNNNNPYKIKNISNQMDGTKYEIEFDINNELLTNHVIDGKIIVPAVLIIDIFKAVCQEGLHQKISYLQNLVFNQLISIDGTIENNKTTVMLKNDGFIEIKYNKTIISSARVFFEKNYYDKSILTEIAHYIDNFEFHQCLQKSDIYNSERMGIYNYGPIYQTINELNYNSQGESTAKISLSYEKISRKNKIIPLLEGAFQSVSGCLLGKEINVAFYPYAIGELEFIDDITENMSCYTKMKFQNQSLATFDIFLINDYGKVCCRLKDYSIKFISNKSSIVRENEIIFGKLVEGGLSQIDLKNSEVIESEVYQVFPKFNSNLSEINVERHIENLENEICSSEYKKIAVFLPSIIKIDSIDTEYRLLCRFIFLFFKMLTNLRNDKKFQVIFFFEKNDSLMGQLYKSLASLFETLRKEYKFKLKLAEVETLELDYNNIISEFSDFSNTYVEIGSLYRKMSRLELDTNQSLGTKFSLIKNNGVYIIAGGTGKIGLLIANKLVDQFNAKVIVLGRRDKRVLNSNIEGKLVFKSCDCENLSLLKHTISSVLDEFGEINGIINCCGKNLDQSFEFKNYDNFKQVLDSKITTTINLDKATENIKLDFFVMFSSISSLASSKGQSDYSMANEFQNNYIEYRRTQQFRFGKSLSINWPYWEDGGMTLPIEKINMYQNLGFIPLNSELGFKVLIDLISNFEGRIYVFFGQSENIKKFMFELQREEKIDGVKP